MPAAASESRFGASERDILGGDGLSPLDLVPHVEILPDISTAIVGAAAKVGGIELSS